ANALAAFRSAGSTAPAEGEKQLALWRKRLMPGQNNKVGPSVVPPPPLKWQPTVQAAAAAAAAKPGRVSGGDGKTQATSIPGLGEPALVWTKGVVLGGDPECDVVLPGVGGKVAHLTLMNRHIFLKALAEGARIGASIIGTGEKRLIDAREFQIGQYT